MFNVVNAERHNAATLRICVAVVSLSVDKPVKDL
jgi:hypothetical protein